MKNIIEQASSFANEIDFVIVLVAIVGGIWLFLAEFVLFYFVFKFSRKNNPKAAYITGEKHDEAKWIHWPHYLVIVCDMVIIFFAVQTWYNIKQTLPPADETVRVIGHQWAWRFVHPGLDRKLDTADDVETVDELHVKVDTVYHFELESADVLHSFSIPVFRLKQDAVPGRTIKGWFKPTKTGEFDLQCAEMCGIGHGLMSARIFIESKSDHEKWLKSQARDEFGQPLVKKSMDGQIEVSQTND